MKSYSIRAACIVLTAALLVGCQSGPRWAWWKQDTAPEEQSLVARSAEPVLPSSQTVPQTIATVDPAATPASATAGTASATMPNVAAPPVSPATIASAPAAKYADTGAAPYPTTNQTAAATPQASQASPYDPNAYQPATSLASKMSVKTPSTDVGLATEAADRYGMTPVGKTPSDDRYGASTKSYASSSSSPAATATPVASATPAATAAIAEPNQTTLPADTDRYASNSYDRYTSASTAAVPASTPAATPTKSVPAATKSPASATAQPKVATATPVTAPQPGIATTAAASVTINAPAGQYRPAGTATYTAESLSSEFEIASRPASTSDQSPTTSAAGSVATPAASPYPTTTPAAPSYRTY